MFNSTFQGKKVLLTGHTGFKGAWLSLWLHQLGAKVTGLALAPETEPSLFSEAKVSECLQAHHLGDVSDLAMVQKAVQESDPDLVVHMAAQALVRRSYREPVNTMQTNFMGTVNVLEAIRLRAKPCAVVVVTTDKCYRNDEHVWGYREIDPLGGDDPYSASKAAAELVVHSYRLSYFNPESKVRLASVRGGNVIGGGDWSEDRIIPDLVRALQAGQELEVRSPGAVRPWQHVLELLGGYLRVAALLLDSQESKWCSSWNFGPLPGQDVPVGELVEQFCQAWGDGRWKDASQPGQLHEANILRLSIEKSLSELGWRPRWTVKQAVEQTANWYRRQTEGGDMREICLADIAAFQGQELSRT